MSSTRTSTIYTFAAVPRQPGGSILGLAKFDCRLGVPPATVVLEPPPTLLLMLGRPDMLGLPGVFDTTGGFGVLLGMTKLAPTLGRPLGENFGTAEGVAMLLMLGLDPIDLGKVAVLCCI